MCIWEENDVSPHILQEEWNGYRSIKAVKNITENKQLSERADILVHCKCSSV